MTHRTIGPAGSRERTASVTELREMITTARPEIVEAGAGTDQRMQLSHELRKILEALADDRPELGPVRERWKQVRRMLGPVAGTGRIPQVTELLITLYGTD